MDLYTNVHVVEECVIASNPVASNGNLCQRYGQRRAKVLSHGAGVKVVVFSRTSLSFLPRCLLQREHARVN